MRAFIAIDVNTNTNIENDGISRVLDGLKAIEGMRIVGRENLHLTLKFLGEIEEGRIDDVHEAMIASFEGQMPFEISLEGVGAFPGPDYARVVWIGVKRNGDLIVEMQKRLDRNLSGLGFKKEGRFHPHVTVARVKSRKGKNELKDLILQHRAGKFGVLMIDKIVLKKSVLTPKGPVYSVIKDVTL